MNAAAPQLLHATCVAIDGHALLITGPSGSGKSDLALRLIDRGAMLVSDDYTQLTARDGKLFARAPERIAGKIEVRGLGIISMPTLQDVPVALLLRIIDRPERMPTSYDTEVIAGVDIPVSTIAALEPSAPIKAELALRQVETSQ